jgi:hypothetical protein
VTTTKVHEWNGSASGGPTTVSGMTGITAGNLLLAVVIEDSDGAFASMTTPSGATYNEIYSSVAVSTAAGFAKIFTRTATSSEPTSLSWPGNINSTNTVYIVELSGYNTGTPFTAAPTWSRPAPAGVTALVAPTVSPAAAGLLFCVYNEMGVSAGQSIAPLSGMAGTSILDPANYMVSLISSLSVASGATGTKTATATSAGSTSGAGYLTGSFVIANASGSTTGTVASTVTVSSTVSGLSNAVVVQGAAVAVRIGSILVPLTVRIKTSRRDSDITKQLSNLSFRSVIPGGYASLQLTLNRPLDVTPDDIEYFANVYVYDGRNGRTIWEGRLEDPGRGVDPSTGEVWSVTAVGPMAHTKDETFPIIYVDQSLDRWHMSRYTTPGQGKVDIGGDLPDSGGVISTGPIPCILLHVDEGSVITTSWAADVIYRSIFYAGQTIARVRCNFFTGGASSNYQFSMFARTNDSTADFSHKKNWVTSPDIMADNLGSGIVATDNMVSFRAERDVSGTTTDTLAWVAVYNVSIRCAIYNPDGSYNLSTSGYNVNNIDPIEVVGDLLGRVLTQYDGANATLIGSGVDIDQLAYPDGTTASDIFDDLATYDPNYYWAAWETNPNTGKYRFEYMPWPDTVRYDCDADDGFDSPGSASDLYNAVNVRWRDAGGRIRFTYVTQSVPVLDDAGLTRTSYIDLSDEMGSESNADYLGQNFLAEHQYPPNAGTLTIGRPILDHDTGRMVMPWEIVPGGLIRVRGVAPSVDALNPTNRDGVTVFRVISVEFDASSATASLELDSYSRSITNQIAKIATTRPRKR